MLRQQWYFEYTTEKLLEACKIQIAFYAKQIEYLELLIPGNSVKNVQQATETIKKYDNLIEIYSLWAKFLGDNPDQMIGIDLDDYQFFFEKSSYMENDF